MGSLRLTKAGWVLFLVCTAALSSPAQILATLASFNGANGTGANPYGSLVQGSDGNFYGTTQLGGLIHGCEGNGCGTVFKITPTGTLTTLYSFCTQRGCADGQYPYAGLVQATDGNFYGTTLGDPHSTAPTYGTVFKITPTGALTTLFTFCLQSGCPDGQNPYAGLVQGGDGNFYGTTSLGGSGNGGQGDGTVFRITSTGVLTTLYNFCSQPNCTDGASPYAGLLQASDGNFYGTASGGGAYNYGTVFKITPAGELTTLYRFNGYPTDGADPEAGLVQATDGNFYGTTVEGGASGTGTVFKITPTGTLTTLSSSGQNPYAGLVQATDGNFYGTTEQGGANGSYGTVFKITPTGTLTTLHSFSAPGRGGTDGAYPYAGLVQEIGRA